MARILLIDDDDMVRKTFRMILEDAGHTVQDAPDGHQGAQRFRAERPDLVITDIFMPEQEGIETILQLRQADASLPIIAITGGSFAARDLDRAARLGATKTLAKPITPKALLAAVAACLQPAAAT